MKPNVTLIIFDWGRTLHDPETNTLFQGVEELISELSKIYALSLVSLAKSDSPGKRRRIIKESGIEEYFKLIIVGGESKDAMYEKILLTLKKTPQETVVVDDRITRGITWGNANGATTVWLKKGKFAEELPNAQSGDPTFVIKDITELKVLFLS